MNTESSQESDTNRVTIVTYHYVRELIKSRYPEIKGLDIQAFKRQIKYFKKLYTIISLTDLINAIENRDNLPEKALFLTFNDNYADHFRNVFPVLDELNISGCFFPEIRTIEDPIVLPNHKIHFILASVSDPGKIVSSIFEIIADLRKSHQLKSANWYFDKLAVKSTYDPKEVVFIKKLLQSELRDDVSEIIINHLFNEFVNVSETVLSQELYMTKEQIKCMHRHGMNFGIIGYNHNRLPSLPNHELKDEIDKSLNFYHTTGINTNMMTVSYPWNDYNADVIEYLNNKGVKAAFTGGSEIADLSIHNRFKLPRFDTNEFPK